VDIEIQVQVERSSRHDVGRAINPLGVIGQVEGGVDGRWSLPRTCPRAGSLPGPKLHRVPDPRQRMPQVLLIVEVLILTVPMAPRALANDDDPDAAAIANAVADALGIRTWSLPMTPERILAALAGE
jgi:hypothetical protein